MLSLKNIQTNKGNDLETLSESFPIILVFLRQFECIFCQEAIVDLTARKKEISDKNLKVIFVHLASSEIGDQYFSKYGFEDAEHISDPSCKIYNDFGLSKGSIGQLFGLKVWARGYELKKTGLVMSRNTVGDSLQMPGIFVIHKGKILDSYIHKSIADKPDYEKLINSSKP